MTPHFKLEEFTFSETAIRNNIDNTPDENTLLNLQTTAEGMEHVRSLLNTPIYITSGYRCTRVNDLLNSKRSSSHILGLACDFKSPSYGSPTEIFKFLCDAGISFDQLILEFSSWIHISFCKDQELSRNQVLIIDKTGVKEIAR